MNTFAVTVLGHDRPGIVAEVTEAIDGLGGNLEDSSMTLLRGHFAMTLVAAVAATANDIRKELVALPESGLVVSVIELPAVAQRLEGDRYLLSVHGGDRPGIVSAITRLIADVGGNVEDLSTRLANRMYVLVAEVRLPSSVDLAELSQTLRQRAADLGVEVRLAPADADVL